MKSTSAWDLGGSFAVVDGGSFLLGLPGAPGWTITGGAAACCARAEEQKKYPGPLTPRNTLETTANARAGRSLCVIARQYRGRLGIWLSIFTWIR
ncbi:MAG TPA: hypothetical protein VJA94_07110 [Candidatus Angelobacter sp.]